MEVSLTVLLLPLAKLGSDTHVHIPKRLGTKLPLSPVCITPLQTNANNTSNMNWKGITLRRLNQYKSLCPIRTPFEARCAILNSICQQFLNHDSRQLGTSPTRPDTKNPSDHIVSGCLMPNHLGLGSSSSFGIL
jgi:hypothetical protein